MSAWQTMDDLKRAMREGISLTEFRRRREEAVRRMVDPAMEAYRKALAEHLIRNGPFAPR